MKKRFLILFMAIATLCTTSNSYAYDNTEYINENIDVDDEIDISNVTPNITYIKSTKKRQITIKYDEIPDVEYYHIVVMTSKNGRYYKEYKTTKTSYVIKKLGTKKTYYIKVRGCIGVFYDEEGEEYARNATLFSSTKKVKIK